MIRLSVKFPGAAFVPAGPMLKRTYPNGRTALVVEEPEEDGFPGGHVPLSVNLVDEPLAADEIAIKDWSPNEGVLDALVAAGVVARPHRHARTGYVDAPICRILLPELLAHL